MPGVWVTHGGNIVHTPFDAAFAIAEVEGDGDYHSLMLAVENGALPDCPLAIITNFGGLLIKDAGGVTDITASLARAKPLVDAGFDCLTECYLRTDDGRPTGLTPAKLDFIATQHLGFPRTQPVFGTFGGTRLEEYEQWVDWPGWSVYLAEYEF